jgi:hypothetical protein
MIGDIRKLRAEKPFVPFTIHLGDGSALRVPTFDHIYVSPHGSSVFVATDGDDYHIVPPLLLSHLTIESGSPVSAT